MEVDLLADGSSNAILADCGIACDCSNCADNAESLAVTRSKSQLKSPLDWEEQKNVRDDVMEEIIDVQKKEQPSKKKKLADPVPHKEDKFVALFRELVDSPLYFTLDQLFLWFLFSGIDCIRLWGSQV